MAYAKIRPRRGTATEWSTANPILAEGEIGIEVPDDGVGTGLVRIKFGDGATAWDDLPYGVSPVNDSIVQNFETTDTTKVPSVVAVNEEILHYYRYLNTRLGCYIDPAEVSDLKTIGRGVYLFNGWATYTDHKPFDNAWGIWFKLADDNAVAVYDFVINFSTGKMYLAQNYGDFTTIN